MKRVIGCFVLAVLAVLGLAACETKGGSKNEVLIQLKDGTKVENGAKVVYNQSMGTWDPKAIFDVVDDKGKDICEEITTSVNPKFSTLYTAEGEYVTTNSTVTVITTDGQTVSVDVVFEIKDDVAPTLKLSAETYTTMETVEFDPSVVFESCIDFGAGRYYFEDAVVDMGGYSVEAPAGEYTITYTITDKAGNKGTASLVLTVTEVQESVVYTPVVDGETQETISHNAVYNPLLDGGYCGVTEQYGMDLTKVSVFDYDYVQWIVANMPERFFAQWSIIYFANADGVLTSVRHYMTYQYDVTYNENGEIVYDEDGNAVVEINDSISHWCTGTPTATNSAYLPKTSGRMLANVLEDLPEGGYVLVFINDGVNGDDSPRTMGDKLVNASLDHALGHKINLMGYKENKAYLTSEFFSQSFDKTTGSTTVEYSYSEGANIFTDVTLFKGSKDIAISTDNVVTTITDANGDTVESINFESGDDATYTVIYEITREDGSVDTIKRVINLKNANKFTATFETRGSAVESINATSVEVEPVSTRLGYKFLGWAVNDEFVTFPYLLTEDVTFQAVFEKMDTLDINGTVIGYTLNDTTMWADENTVGYTFVARLPENGTVAHVLTYDSLDLLKSYPSNWGGFWMILDENGQFVKACFDGTCYWIEDGELVNGSWTFWDGSAPSANDVLYNVKTMVPEKGSFIYVNKYGTTNYAAECGNAIATASAEYLAATKWLQPTIKFNFQSVTYTELDYSYNESLYWEADTDHYLNEDDVLYGWGTGYNFVARHPKFSAMNMVHILSADQLGLLSSCASNWGGLVILLNADGTFYGLAGQVAGCKDGAKDVRYMAMYIDEEGNLVKNTSNMVGNIFATAPGSNNVLSGIASLVPANGYLIYASNQSTATAAPFQENTIAAKLLNAFAKAELSDIKGKVFFLDPAKAPEKETVTVTFESTGSAVEAKEVKVGETLTTMPVSYKLGYELVGWTVNGELVEFPYVVEGTTKLVAKFEYIEQPTSGLNLIGLYDDVNVTWNIDVPEVWDDDNAHYYATEDLVPEGGDPYRIWASGYTFVGRNPICAKVVSVLSYAHRDELTGLASNWGGFWMILDANGMFYRACFNGICYSLDAEGNIVTGSWSFWDATPASNNVLDGVADMIPENGYFVYATNYGTGSLGQVLGEALTRLTKEYVASHAFYVVNAPTGVDLNGLDVSDYSFTMDVQAVWDDDNAHYYATEDLVPEGGDPYRIYYTGYTFVGRNPIMGGYLSGVSYDNRTWLDTCASNWGGFWMILDADGKLVKWIANNVCYEVVDGKIVNRGQFGFWSETPANNNVNLGVSAFIPEGGYYFYGSNYGTGLGKTLAAAFTAASETYLVNHVFYRA